MRHSNFWLPTLKSHVELEELGLGIQIYDLENPDDFIIKLNELLLNEDLRNSLREKSLNNINKLDWTSRTKTILSSVRSSTDRAPDFGSGVEGSNPSGRVS